MASDTAPAPKTPGKLVISTSGPYVRSNPNATASPPSMPTSKKPDPQKPR